jgi:hypothetical protein
VEGAAAETGVTCVMRITRAIDSSNIMGVNGCMSWSRAMQIEIDFDVFKALTLRRENESISYNDVLRELLGLNKTSAQPPSRDSSETTIKAFASPEGVEGYAYRGGFLPNGTKLKALYKNRIYNAEIVDGLWINEDGSKHATPTSAAGHITKTSTDARRFWSAKRPSDGDWYRLNSLPNAIS